MSTSQESANAFELIVTAGNATGSTIPLAKPRLAFGSAQGNDVQLEEQGVKPKHAEMAIAADGAVWIRDLTGSGETTVNGAPVETARLESGSFIRLGTVELCLRKKDSGPRAASASPAGFGQPSGASPVARVSGAAPAAAGAPQKPKSGPNDTMLRPSGPAQPPRAGSGPNDTVMRPSVPGSTPGAAQDGYSPEQGHVELGDASQAPPPGRAGAMLAPDQVVADRYRVIAKLASGGMGEVYRVDHVELGKPFALKVMRKEMSSDPEFVERFKREAITASRIGQQNIVDISDFGRTDAGLFYFVMEYLQGETVADLLKREKVLTLGRAMPIIIQICRALSAAHKQGIVHRDMKPENVMLLQRPEQPDLVKVLDFGVAKVAAGQGSGGQTALGIVLGTPQYMAPEQAAGMPVDARSDIYSLGLIIYELISGRTVFEEATPSLLMVAHINREPPPMTPGPITNPLPPGLEPLVMRMLAKRPEDRPQTMDEVAIGLEVCAPEFLRRTSGAWVSGRPASGASVAMQAARLSGSAGAVAPGAAPGSGPASAAQAGSGPVAAPAKSKAPLFAVAGVVGVAVIGAAGFLALRAPAPAVAAPPPVAVAQPTVPVPPVPAITTPVPPPTPVKAELVKLSVKAKPDRVEVYNGEILLGTTPSDIQWEKGKTGQLRFVAEGYLPETRTVQPNGDTSLEISLKPKAAARPTTGKKPARPESPGGSPDEDLKDAPY